MFLAIAKKCEPTLLILVLLSSNLAEATSIDVIDGLTAIYVGSKLAFTAHGEGCAGCPSN